MRVFVQIFIVASAVLCLANGQQSKSSMLNKLVQKRDVDFSQFTDLEDFDRLKKLVGEKLESLKQVTSEGIESLKKKLKDESLDIDSIVQNLEKIVPSALLNDRLIAEEDNKIESLNETKNVRRKRISEEEDSLVNNALNLETILTTQSVDLNQQEELNNSKIESTTVEATEIPTTTVEATEIPTTTVEATEISSTETVILENEENFEPATTKSIIPTTTVQVVSTTTTPTHKSLSTTLFGILKSNVDKLTTLKPTTAEITTKFSTKVQAVTSAVPATTTTSITIPTEKVTTTLITTIAVENRPVIITTDVPITTTTVRSSTLPSTTVEQTSQEMTTVQTTTQFMTTTVESFQEATSTEIEQTTVETTTEEIVATTEPVELTTTTTEAITTTIQVQTITSTVQPVSTTTVEITDSSLENVVETTTVDQEQLITTDLQELESAEIPTTTVENSDQQVSNEIPDISENIKFEVTNYTAIDTGIDNPDTKSYSLRLHIKGYQWNDNYQNVNSTEAQEFLKAKIMPLLYKYLNVTKDELNEVKLVRLLKGKQ